jgi:hypothetical protein
MTSWYVSPSLAIKMRVAFALNSALRSAMDAFSAASNLITCARSTPCEGVPTRPAVYPQRWGTTSYREVAALRTTPLACVQQVTSLGDAESSLGDAESSLGDAKSSLGDAWSSRGDAVSSLGDAKSSLGDAKSSLGDAESSLGDAERSLGDAKS